MVVGNVLYNPIKHNYRIHGTSDLHYAARNTINGGGVMIGDGRTDRVGKVWFNDNVLNHTTEDLFNMKGPLEQISAHNNTVISRQWGEGGRFPPGRAKVTDLENNKVAGGTIDEEVLKVLKALRDLPKK